LVSKGVALGKLGNYHEAIPAYDQVVEWFGDTRDAEL
jgi:hypothetical protein